MCSVYQSQKTTNKQKRKTTAIGSEQSTIHPKPNRSNKHLVNNK